MGAALSHDSASVKVRPAAIFWDMDGTLSDSEPLWEKAIYYTSAQMGREATPAVRAETVGGTVFDALAILARWVGRTLPPEEIEHYKGVMFDYVSELYATELVLFPGVSNLLEGVRADGIPQYLTTNTQRAVADPVIDAIGRDFFTDTVCGDEVPNGKPAPDIYLEAARRANAEPGQCLVFEDSPTGMRAAVTAGCVVVGLPHDGTTVPDGATPIARLHGGTHLEGATVADMYRWYAELVCT